LPKPLTVAAALAAAGAFAMPLAVLAPKSVAPLFVVAAIAALAARVVRARAAVPVPVRLTVALLSFAALAVLSALWSIDSGQTLKAAGAVSGLLFAAAALIGLAARVDDPGREIVRGAVMIGGAIGIGLVVVEVSFDRPILVAYHTWLGNPVEDMSYLLTALKPTASVLALFAWPLLLAARHRYSRIVALAAGGILLALFAALKAATPLIAFLFGGAAFVLARRCGRLVMPLLGAVLTIGILVAPWIPSWLPSPEWETRKLHFLSNSTIHRIQIWQTTADHIHDRFWLGHGFNSARRMYPQGTNVEKILRRDDPAKTFINPFEPIPLHPHNMILQIWLELGLAGAILVLMALGTVLATLHRAALEKTEKAAGYAFFVTALTIGCISFGAWQAWWLSTIFLNAALMVAVFSRPLGSAGEYPLSPGTARRIAA
jgi:O-antigen ligase